MSNPVRRMQATISPIVETYSRLAKTYDDDLNQQSCWGLAAEKALASLSIRDDCQLVVDVGCGTGRALWRLARNSRPGIQFIGIDPAKNMCARATERTKRNCNIKILDGGFEKIPLESWSVDYMYSIFAFHWTTDLEASVKEISRVLKPTAEMDLFFIGRNNGREFIQRTSPIFLKYMGPALLLDSARMRKQLKKEEAFNLFAATLSPERLSVEESYETYYDSLEGHWGWWVRIEGQFIGIPSGKREACNREVRDALLTLAGEKGIPYTIHRLHVILRRG
jgi:ubiquinone/menaquinone biosynthesis C-methylase UbiE